MPATLNFLDVIKANSPEVVGELIEENVNASPELQYFPLEDLETPGQLSYDTLHRTGFPTVQFAYAGEGFDPSKSTLEQKSHECFRFGGRVEAPRHIADNWRRGGAAGYQAFEASGVIEAALKLIGRQIWYGVAYDGKGFPGIKAFTPKNATYTFDAQGTTANTASSVYAVKFGPKYCQLMGGRARNGNGIMDLPDFRIGDMEDSNGKKMEAYLSELSSYIGLQIAAEFSVARLLNVTADANHTLSDAMLADFLDKLPADFVPDAIFYSRRSRTQLRKSRTVVLNGTGEERPNQPNIAPMPKDYEGIPLVATDNILNTDAIE